jgi:hypothetical protein
VARGTGRAGQPKWECPPGPRYERQPVLPMPILAYRAAKPFRSMFPPFGQAAGVTVDPGAFLHFSEHSSEFGPAQVRVSSSQSGMSMAGFDSWRTPRSASMRS